MSLNIHYSSNNSRLNKFLSMLLFAKSETIKHTHTYSQIVSVMITVEKQISDKEKAAALKQIEVMNAGKKEKKKTFKFF